MNTLTRFLAGLGVAAMLVLSFFFFATIGLMFAGLMAVLLLISYFRRGKGSTSGAFRVVDIRTDENGTVFRQTSFRALDGEAKQADSSDIVDIPPEEYRSVSTENDHADADGTEELRGDRKN